MNNTFSTAVAAVFTLVSVSGWVAAEQTKTVYNPFSGKPDYITKIDANTIVAGSGVSVNCTNGACTIDATGGGGGSSSLEVVDGVRISSPTGTISFDSSQFSGTFIAPSTASIALNSSSVTLQGNAFNGNNQLVQLNTSGVPPSGWTNYLNYPATGTWVAGQGITASTITADTVSASTFTASTNITVDGGNNIVMNYGSFPVGTRSQILWKNFGSTNGGIGFSDSLPAGFRIYDSNNNYIVNIFSNDSTGISPRKGLSLPGQNQIRFYDNDSSNYISLRSTGSLASDYNYFLPETYGTGGMFLQTDGTGNLVWATPSGGSGGGSLAVTTGSLTGYVGPPVSSPTAVINFDSTRFSNTLTDSATNFVTLLSSQVFTNLQASTMTVLNNAFVTGNTYVGAKQVPVEYPSDTYFSRVEETVLYNTNNSGFSKGAAGTLQTITDDVIRSTAAILLTSDGIGSAVVARKLSISPTIDFTGRQVVLYVKTTNYANMTEGLLYLSSDNLSANFFVFDWAAATSGQTYKYVTEGDWVRITLNFGMATRTGSPDRSAINSIQLRIKDNASGTTSVKWNGIATIPEPQRGVVSLTFDDSYSSQNSTAAAIMDQFGFRGTAYTIPNNIGLSSTYLSTTTLRNLRDAHGWEIALHDETDYTTYSTTTLKDVIAAAKTYMVSEGFTTGLDGIAYPNGAFNGNMIRIARQYFNYGRTIITGPSATTPYFETIPPAEPMKLRAIVVSSTTSNQTLYNYASRAATNKEWLILDFHNLTHAPSTSIDVDTGTFTTFISTLAALNVDVLPVGEVMRQIPAVTRISSATFNVANLAGPQPSFAAYGLSVGSITIRNVASGTQCLQADASGNVTGTGSACSVGGGGGSSTLEVTVGPRISSPTATIAFNFNQFTGTLAGSATSQIDLNSSSVTLQGNSIRFTDLSTRLDNVAVATNTLAVSVLGVSWDGGGSALTTGTTYWMQIPSSGTITEFTISGLPSGSVTVNVSSSAAFNTGPGSICAAACPSLSASTFRRDITLTGWTTSLAKDGWLYFVVNSASTIQQLLVKLGYTKQ
jgi:peptidoglycan/xylan/chitin deacetylase (PgdA/CDA1 family)